MGRLTVSARTRRRKEEDKEEGEGGPAMLASGKSGGAGGWGWGWGWGGVVLCLGAGTSLVELQTLQQSPMQRTGSVRTQGLRDEDPRTLLGPSSDPPLAPGNPAPPRGDTGTAAPPAAQQTVTRSFHVGSLRQRPQEIHEQCLNE